MNTIYYPPSSPLTVLSVLDCVPVTAIGMNDCYSRRCLSEGLWQCCHFVASTFGREFLFSGVKILGNLPCRVKRIGAILCSQVSTVILILKLKITSISIYQCLKRDIDLRN